MKSTPDNLAHDLAALYDESVSDAEAALMADRLTAFAGLLMEIEAERQGQS
ncbi:MAG TPA: hypothetical protein V6C52_11580 [Coleofasciculaceae cyanobacterium]|jgi:hypothetical protein